jgi:ABC-type proline/glycine betaine transport system permease subunit
LSNSETKVKSGVKQVFNTIYTINFMAMLILLMAVYIPTQNLSALQIMFKYLVMPAIAFSLWLNGRKVFDTRLAEAAKVAEVLNLYLIYNISPITVMDLGLTYISVSIGIRDFYNMNGDIKFKSYTLEELIGIHEN